MQVTSCTGQRASVGYLDLLSSKSGGNVSTFAPDTCTAGTGGSLQKLALGQHMPQEDALQFARPHEQVGGEQTTQRLKLVSITSHITAWKLKSLTGNALTPHYLFLFRLMPLSCIPQLSLSLAGREIRPNEPDRNKISLKFAGMFLKMKESRGRRFSATVGGFCYCCFVLFINPQKPLGGVLQITIYWFLSCVAWAVLIRECLTRIALIPPVCPGCGPQCSGSPLEGCCSVQSSASLSKGTACCSQRLV